eukprot:8489889-Alexandrium_andersonii.AAC.1
MRQSGGPGSRGRQPPSLAGAARARGASRGVIGAAAPPVRPVAWRARLWHVDVRCHPLPPDRGATARGRPTGCRSPHGKRVGRCGRSR